MALAAELVTGVGAYVQGTLAAKYEWPSLHEDLTILCEAGSCAAITKTCGSATLVMTGGDPAGLIPTLQALSSCSL